MKYGLKKGSSPFVSASIAEKVAATASVSAITFGNVKSIEQASKSSVAVLQVVE